jgi:hypothetical protein
MRRAVVLAIGVAVAVVASGCGTSTTPVSGTVTYRGKTVVWGNVSIVASDNMHYSADINEDGTFSIPKIPTGPCKIGVTSQNPNGDPAPSPMAKKNLGSAAPRKDASANRPKPPPGKWFEIQDMYRDPVTSGLTGEIRKGEPLNVTID